MYAGTGSAAFSCTCGVERVLAGTGTACAVVTAVPGAAAVELVDVGKVELEAAVGAVAAEDELTGPVDVD